VTGPPPPEEELLAPLLLGRTMVDPSSPPLLDAPELELVAVPPSSPPVTPGRGPPLWEAQAAAVARARSKKDVGFMIIGAPLTYRPAGTGGSPDAPFVRA
jgi:hypothetical protein